MHDFTLFNTRENKESCNGYTPLHSDWKNSSHNHLPVILTMLLDLKTPLFLDFRSCSDTVSSNCYWQTLTSKGDLQRDVLWWLSQQPEELFADGIHWLLHHLGSCWNANGRFFSDCCSSFTCDHHPIGFICVCLMYQVTRLSMTLHAHVAQGRPLSGFLICVCRHLMGFLGWRTGPVVRP